MSYSAAFGWPQDVVGDIRIESVWSINARSDSGQTQLLSSTKRKVTHRVKLYLSVLIQRFRRTVPISGGHVFGTTITYGDCINTKSAAWSRRRHRY